MKHVFFINSHTTYLTSMGVIDYLRLQNEKILLILVRNYKNITMRDYPSLDWSELSSYSENIFNNKLKASKIRNIIENVDAAIKSKIGDSYHIYAPHLSHPLWQLAYTNKACKGFSYIQEGVLPFTTAFVDKPHFLGRLENLYMNVLSSNRVWYYRPWFLRTEIRDIRKVDAYANNDKFFHHLPLPVHIIKWPMPAQKVKNDFEKEHTIFVYDAFVKNGIMNGADYLEMCKKLIDTNASLHNYLKFHPGQSKEEINAIKTYFVSKNLSYEILENSVPLEYVIMKNKGLNLAGYGSSLLFLAYDYGHTVTCNDDELLQFPLYRKYRKNYGFMSFKEYAKS